MQRCLGDISPQNYPTYIPVLSSLGAHVYQLTSGVNGHYLAILPPHGACERVVLEGDPDMLALLQLRRLGSLVQAIST